MSAWFLRSGEVRESRGVLRSQEKVMESQVKWRGSGKVREFYNSYWEKRVSVL